MTTNTLSTYDFNGRAIRVVTIDDEPWFVAADVYRAIDLKKGSQGYHMSLLADDEKGYEFFETPGGKQLGRTLSESGLYKLVLRSDKAEAKDFQNWVTREVLPSIRKNGGYIKGQELLATGDMTSTEFLARAQIVAQRLLEDQQAMIAAHEQTIAKQKDELERV